MIFGTNEETGMADCRYYLEHEKAPLMGLPGNKFPAIYGERGRAVVRVIGSKELAVPFINEYFMKPKQTVIGLALMSVISILAK